MRKGVSALRLWILARGFVEIRVEVPSCCLVEQGSWQSGPIFFLAKLNCRKGRLAFREGRGCLVSFVLLFLGLLHGHVDVEDKSEDTDADSPVLHFAEVGVEEEFVKEELVDHVEVAHDLQFARSLVLEG